LSGFGRVLRQPLWIAAIAGVAVCLVLPGGATAAITFFEPETYEQGMTRGMDIVDFDEDGHQDVLTGVNGGIAVGLGDGEGGFDIETYPLGDSLFPGTINTGDLDGDGVLDVLAAGRLFRGDGAGGLGAGTMAVPFGSDNAVLGDFGGDDRLDVAVPRDLPSRHVALLIQQPDGSFIHEVSLAVSLPPVLAVADLDSDGDDDIVGVDPSNGEVLVFRQGAGGVFASAVRHDVGGHPTGAEIVDVDGDGLLDVVSADFTGQAVSVLPGTGPGQFGTRESYSVEDFPADVEAGDLDGDADMDLVTTPGNTGKVQVLLQGDDGSFERLDGGQLYANGSHSGTEMADFDEDGEDDLALEVSGSGVGIAFGDALHVSTDLIDFGWLSAFGSATQSFTVHNTGSAPVAPGAIEVMGLSPGAFSIVGNGCAGTLPRRATCEVDVRFDAPGATEELFDLVEIQGSSASGPRYVFVEAASFLSAFLSPSPSAIDFGYVGAGRRSAPREVRIVNAGDEPAEVAEVFASAGFGVGVDTCSDELLLPEDDCVVSVDFRPTASSPLAGTLTVTYAGGGPAPASIALRGTRTPPTRPLRPAKTPPPVDYGPVDRDLARLTSAFPKLLRGGPAGLLRLPRFETRRPGTLRVRAHLLRKGKRVALVDARARVKGGVPRRLGFRLAPRKRKLLRGSRPVRVKAVVTFRPFGTRLIFRQTSEIVVRAPKR